MPWVDQGVEGCGREEIKKALTSIASTSHAAPNNGMHPTPHHGVPSFTVNGGAGDAQRWAASLCVTLHNPTIVERLIGYTDAPIERKSKSSFYQTSEVKMKTIKFVGLFVVIGLMFTSLNTQAQHPLDLLTNNKSRGVINNYAGMRAFTNETANLFNLDRYQMLDQSYLTAITSTTLQYRGFYAYLMVDYNKPNRNHDKPRKYFSNIFYVGRKRGQSESEFREYQQNIKEQFLNKVCTTYNEECIESAGWATEPSDPNDSDKESALENDQKRRVKAYGEQYVVNFVYLII